MGLRLRSRAAAVVAGALLALPVLGAHASPPIRLRSCLGERVTITGTPGDDRLKGTGGPDVIAGRGGRDVILGGDGDDRICGGKGLDRIHGRYGADLLDGGDGSDLGDGGPGSDLLLGGAGHDRLFGGDGGSGDTLVGNDGSDFLSGGDGRSDSDYLFGGESDDTLDGGLGAEDRLYGGAGDDSLAQGLVSYEFATQPVFAHVVPLNPGGAHAVGEGTDRFSEVDGVVGSPQSDVLSGGDGAETLRGLEGDDSIRAGAGDDEVDGGAGSDELDGGEGRDLVSFYDSPVGVTASLADEAAQGDAALLGFESLTGSYFDDSLTGDDGPNSIDGSYGRNAVFGLAGSDFIARASEGDAGAGHDNCADGEITSCEVTLEADYLPFPSITSPVQRGEVDRLGTVTGEAFGGDGPVYVGIRRMTSEGCWWWDGAAARWQRGHCGAVTGSKLRVRRHRWALEANASRAPGAYFVTVTWWKQREALACAAPFQPSCVELYVR